MSAQRTYSDHVVNRSSDKLAPLGIIAGNGRLPLLTADGMRRVGREVIGVGLAGQFINEVPQACDQFFEVGLMRPGEWAKRLRRCGVSQAVMIGGVTKKNLLYESWLSRFRKTRPDFRAIKLWYRVLRFDRRSQTVLAALADELNLAGVSLMDSTTYIADHMADTGKMTSTGPGAEQMADIEFGWPILMEMNRLEIGQALAVRGRDVVAVEAIEGTDAMIERAGKLAKGGGWTLLKGAGPDKDRRFDVPTIGVRTIEGLAAAGAVCLALEPGGVILMDRLAVLAAAEKAGIRVYGYAS